MVYCETIENTSNPKWKQFKIRVLAEDYRRRLKIKVFDTDLITRDDKIGTFIAPMNQLKRGSVLYPISGHGDTGSLRVERFDVS